MNCHTGVLVVGASAAGLATVDALRRGGYRDRITLLGAELHLPYDRPPLSKQVLTGAWEPERTMLSSPRALADLDIDLILGSPALALDASAMTVRTGGGTIHADHIVIATGATPRLLPEQAGLGGVHVLRTLDDALALRNRMKVAERVVVVGEGVLGAEIAATARQCGREVTMTGPQHAPMALQLGEFVAGRLAELHVRHGVTLRLGVGVTGFSARRGAVDGVLLDAGQQLPADLVVVAIGALPATDWLTGSGLRLDNGVLCDAACRAADNIYAVGDVARRRLPGTEETVRLENRTNATEQALVAAANITGADRFYHPIPYFWTDQFATKIQVYGTITADAIPTVIDGDAAGDRFVVRYDRAGAPTAVLGWNMPKQARIARQQLAEGASV